MKQVFADTLYWIATARPNDAWAPAAHAARAAAGPATLVTTDEVLGEFLTSLSRGGPAVRRVAVEMVRAILSDPNVHVVPQTRDGFLRGLDRFAARQDKSYSLTDCISMSVMESLAIRDVLTNDHHFEQDGFTVLIR